MTLRARSRSISRNRGTSGQVLSEVGAPKQPEDGAALVEFALILPLFVMLILGMFTGGLAYLSKISITGAAREGSRYGATAPIGPSTPSCGTAVTNVDRWLECVSDVAYKAASGEMDTSVASRYICVSFVNPSGAGDSDAKAFTHTLEVTGATEAFSTGEDCYSKAANALGTDGFTTQARVQVVLKRTRKLEALLFSTNLSLRSFSATHYETFAS